MGVKGLWRLLLPIGRRISIEILEGKILAVDASIWMTQFLKAMRDPDSGGVRPAAHIIGFFRRLCRLRFHGIRPVFVFDGETPEIKKREIALRRKRRDAFVATHGPAAVTRMAKKLLVEQLKKSKAKLLVSATKSVTIKTTSQQRNDDRGGAFASGFNLPEREIVDHTASESPRINLGDWGDEGADKSAKDGIKEKVVVPDNDASEFEIRDGEVIITNVVKPESTLNEPTSFNSEDNDWDKPIADEIVTAEGEEQNEGSDNDFVEYDDILWNARKKRRKKKASGDEIFDADYVASLPPDERKDAIAEAQKKQRMRSRREFMPVAANASEYSQVQLRNFLRSSRLNKDIVKMGKQAVDKDSKMFGEVMASDRTRRVIFEKEGEEKESCRLISHNASSSDGDDDDDDDDDDDHSESGGFLSGRGRPTSALRKNSKQKESTEASSPQIEKVPSRSHKLRKLGGNRIQSTSSNESDNEGGGFLVSTEKAATLPAVGRPHIKRRIIVEDVDEDSDGPSNGGGFLPASEQEGPSTPSKNRSSVGASKKVVFDDKDTDDEGGFIRNSAEPNRSSGAVKISLKEVKGAAAVRDNDEVLNGGGFIGKSTNRTDSRESADVPSNAGKVAPIAAFRPEYDEISDEGGGGFVPRVSEDRIVEHYAAKAAKAATARVGNLFEHDSDDDSPQEGGGFLRGKPVHASQLKTTGLTEEVIVIDDEGDAHGGKSRTNDATAAQELNDQMLAKALQEEEDEHLAASYADSGGAGIEMPYEANETSAKKPGWLFGHGLNRSNNSAELDTQKLAASNQPIASKQVEVLATSTTSNLFLTGDDDREEDDIDWEDADDVPESEEQQMSNSQEMKSASRRENNEYDKVGRTQRNAPPHRENGVASQSPVIEVGDDDDDDDVCWEEGDDQNDEPDVSVQQNAPSAAQKVSILDVDDADEGEPVSWENSSDKDDGSMGEKLNRTGQNMYQARPLGAGLDENAPEGDAASSKGSAYGYESSDDVVGKSEEFDDFGAHQEVNNAAALEQAEATASNLTNWAGRAVRLAIAEHLKGSGGSARHAEERSPEITGKREAYSIETDSKQIDEIDRLENSGEDNNVEKGMSTHSETASNYLSINEDHTEEADKMVLDYESELVGGNKNDVEREMDTVTDEMQEEIIQLLQLFGVPYIRAPAEAEAQCAALEKLGLVSGIVTEDSDVFVFGGKTVYKNIFDDQKYVEVYKAEDAEREMGLGYNEFVALAMLLGGDYTEGVKGVGIVNGMEIVSSFDVKGDLKNGLQKFRTWLDGFEPVVAAQARKDTGASSLSKEQAFHIKHRTARNRWTPPENFPAEDVISAYVNPVVDKSTARFSWGVPDMENIVAFCSKHAGWPAEETKRVLEPVIERVESKSTQTRIDSFMRYEDSIKFANVRSKRLRDVLHSVNKEDGASNGSQDADGPVDAPTVKHTPSKATRAEKKILKRKQHPAAALNEKGEDK
jgi:5'-3' exonuclease